MNMYSHFMVPVDDSMLSLANIQSAVQLALRLDAKITFFHATADLAATGDGVLLRTIAPLEFSTTSVGETHAVLSKARATAHASGVACETVHRVCDRPAEAILEAARASGCDLIVMATRGLRGVSSWLHSSQTERVLRQSPMPLLITRVASSDPITASERALAIIQDEHRSIAVVMRSMLDLMPQSRAPGEVPDLRSIEAMLTYMQDFPLQLHHPKEERYLHRWLRLRAPASETVLLELEAQHVREHALVDEAVKCVREAKSGSPAALAALGPHIETLADAVWKHMKLEESVILPMAAQHLQDGDWQDIAAAFENNQDPSFGELPASEFRRLFTRIANLLPAIRH
jgi:nucleotide-binding universal stress UspA family protein/hemerythrin-like domain-containing protein